MILTDKVQAFNELVRSLRKSRGLNMKEAADALEINEVTLRNIELGYTKGIQYYILERMEILYNVRFNLSVTIEEPDFYRLMDWKNRKKAAWQDNKNDSDE